MFCEQNKTGRDVKVFTFTSSKPIPKASMGKGWADMHMVKGVFVRLSFDAIRISQIQRQIKNKATKNASWGVLYTDLIGFNRFLDCCQRVDSIYLHWRGAFSVARFDLSGNARAYIAWDE